MEDYKIEALKEGHSELVESMPWTELDMLMGNEVKGLFLEKKEVMEIFEEVAEKAGVKLKDIEDSYQSLFKNAANSYWTGKLMKKAAGDAEDKTIADIMGRDVEKIYNKALELMHSKDLTPEYKYQDFLEDTLMAVKKDLYKAQISKENGIENGFTQDIEFGEAVKQQLESEIE